MGRVRYHTYNRIETIPVSVELLAGILGGLIVAMVVLLLLQVRNSAVVNRIAAPAYEFVQQQAAAEAAQIVEAAKAEAAQIVASTRAEQESVLVAYREQAISLQKTYEAQLSGQVTNLQEQIHSTIAAHFGQIESVAKEAARLSEERTKTLEGQFEAVKTRYAALGDTLETKAATLSQSLTDAVTRTSDEVTRALEAQEQTLSDALAVHVREVYASVDAAVVSYQKERYALVDTHLERMVETVITEVLETNLTLSDHAAIVQSSLAAAKEAGDLRG